MMALRLLGWLRGLIGSLGQFIRRDPKLALCLLLAAFGLWERHQAAKWRDRAEQYQTASQAAAVAQVATNHEPARKSGAIAKESNHEAPAYYRAAAVAADAHAVRMRAPSGPVDPDMPGADPLEPGVHGPTDIAGLVCRPDVEDSQIIGAASRAAEMHQEALDLIAEGVAVGE